MDDLITFLRARVLDDEESVILADCRCVDEAHKRPDCPDRILDDVAAKQGILGEHRPDPSAPEFCIRCGSDDTDDEGNLGRYRHDFPCRTLRLLALPYAEHPDYRPDWKPDDTP